MLSGGFHGCSKGVFFSGVFGKTLSLSSGYCWPCRGGPVWGSFDVVATARPPLKPAVIGLWMRVDAFLGGFSGLALPQLDIRTPLKSPFLEMLIN